MQVGEAVRKARGVSRLDDLCYDNTNVQVDSLRGERPGNIPKIPRPDQVCYDIENGHMECDDVG